MNEKSKLKPSVELLVENGLFAATNNQDERNNVLDKLINFIKIVKLDEDFVKQANKDGDHFDFQTAIKLIIAKKQSDLNNKVTEIIHAKPFNELVGKFHGIKYFLDNINYDNIEVNILCISQKALEKDLMKHADIRDTFLWREIREKRIGTYGEYPFTAIGYDFKVTSDQQTVKYIQKITEVAAGSHAKLFAGAKSTLLGLSRMDKINFTRDLMKAFDGPTKLAWETFRNTRDSSYLTLVIPDIYSQPPYGPDYPAEGVPGYHERVNSDEELHFRRMSAIFAVLANICRSFTETGSLSRITGVDGGFIDNLPLIFLQTPRGLIRKPPVDAVITDNREDILANKLGISSLIYNRCKNELGSFALQTIHKSQKYMDPRANANSLIAANSVNILLSCRFIQMLKMMLRDYIGGMYSAEQMENELQSWLSNYILLNPNAPRRLKWEYPLKDASVSVKEIPGKPGSFHVEYVIVPFHAVHSMFAEFRAEEVIQRRTS